MKDVIVIGGPNGAGKTTAASRLLPTTLGLHEFVNADEIARGLSPNALRAAAITFLMMAWFANMPQASTTRDTHSCRLRTWLLFTTVQVLLHC